MKKSRYTEEQIVVALKQAETGTPVAEVIRRMGLLLEFGGECGRDNVTERRVRLLGVNVITFAQKQIALV
jgi:hypothetical protein